MDFKKSYQLLDNLFASGKEVVFERREIIIGYNRETSMVYRIEEGCVKVISYTASGSERIHFLYGPGDMFPVRTLLKGQTEEIGFVALSRVKLRAQPVKTVYEFLDKEPYTMLALWEQQSSVSGGIVDLNFGSAEQRLAYRLMELSRKFGTMVHGHYVINLPLTIQEIADMIRLTRETTGKVLAQFEQRGYIIFSRQQLLVYPDELERIIDGQVTTSVPS